jgi:hypothetical protein
MIFRKLIFETSGATHVSFTDVELQAEKPRNAKAVKAAAAKQVIDFVFKGMGWTSGRRFCRGANRAARQLLRE